MRKSSLEPMGRGGASPPTRHWSVVGTVRKGRTPYAEQDGLLRTALRYVS